MNMSSTSIRVQQTLDPCVVLMKQLISKYEPLWNSQPATDSNSAADITTTDATDHKDGHGNSNKIYNLSQGIVYWSPPSSVSQAMISALQPYDPLENPPEEHEQDQRPQDIQEQHDSSSSSVAAAAATAAVSVPKTARTPDSNSLLHQYAPDEGMPELIQALKVKFQRENHLPSKSNNDQKIDVIVTSGANQAYMNCIITLLSEGERCVIFQPYYFNHVMAVQMIRGNDALLIGPMDEDGCPSLDWLRVQLEQQEKEDERNRIKIVTVVNPGNPTGISIPTEKLQALVNLCRAYDHVWLIMDCTYEHFDHSGSNSFRIENHNDCGINNNNTNSTDDDNNTGEMGFHCFDDDHVINLFSFSKGYAMAGYRVGAITINTAHARGRDAYQQMIKVQDTIPICASRISQVAALGALSVGRKWVLDKVQTLNLGRELILDALQSLECCMGGSGAMYVMAKLPDGMEDDLLFAERLIEKYGIAVIPGNFCGLPGWIRVCYANLPPEEYEIAAARLKSGILDLCGNGGGGGSASSI